MPGPGRVVVTGSLFPRAGYDIRASLESLPHHPPFDRSDLTGDGHFPDAKGNVIIIDPPFPPDPGEVLSVLLNDRAAWTGIPRAVWEYKLGGYQVLKKWLSYREHDILTRPLTPDEIAHFTQTARRIATLLALAPTLDTAHHTVCAALIQGPG